MRGSTGPSFSGSWPLWAIRSALVAAGLCWILHSALGAHGGRDRLWQYTRTPQHRLQAMAMLTGTLRLRGSVGHVWFDEQVHHGAVYTNWGLGVPLLQMPFQALAAHRMKARFFPDRAIFFVYLAGATPLLWAAFARLLSMRFGLPRLSRGVLSWAATWAVVAITLFPLMACRFIMYEETIAYFVLCELAALACYLLAVGSFSPFAVCGMAAAAGLGLLVRPTGLIHLGIWAALIVIESRRKRAVIAFAATAVPFVAFWAYSNWVRTGSLWGTGFVNQAASAADQTEMLRFGSQCLDRPEHVRAVARWLFDSFFFVIPNDMPPWMQACRFVLEERPPGAHEPFFGPAVLVLLVGIPLHLAVRGERRLGPYLPFAGMVVLFGCYVYAGAGFAWRYVGDFWPLIVLGCATYVTTLRIEGRRLALPLAAALVACSLGAYRRSVDLWQDRVYYPHWDPLQPPAAVESLWQEFVDERWGMDRPFPSRIRCGEATSGPRGNGVGWNGDCGVDVVTNVYLGVPKKGNDDHYEIRIETQGVAAAELPVYLDGHVYRARREGATYRAAVRISYSTLHSAIVVATIRWAHEHPSSERLVSIELA